jgi:O-antigen/teichoic acid export membrane protein
MFIISILSFVHSKMLVHKIDKVDIIDNLPSNISILSSSFGYFLISIGAALVWNTDNILIAKFLPLQQVTIYSLTFRIYTVGFLVFSTINSVLMPYYGIFKSQGSFDKIQKSFDNAVMVSSFLAMGIWISTFLFSRDIIYFWTNDTQLYGGRNLFLVMGFYGFILSFLTSTGILFSGIKIIKIPVYLTFVEGFVNLAASLFLITKYGILGVAIGTLIGALTNFFLVNVFFNKAVNNLIKSPIYFLFKNFLFGIVFIMFILVFRLDEFNLNSKLYFFVFIIFLYSYLFYKINNVNFKDLNLFKNTIKDE